MPAAELRPFVPEDLERVSALNNMVEAADGVPRVVTVEELRSTLAVPYIDMATDTRGAWSDGEMVGWAWVWNPPSVARVERAYLAGGVHPQHRDRGIGRLLFGWSLDRARERLLSRSHGLPRVVRVDTWESRAAWLALYERFGLKPVRWFEELVRPLDDLPPLTLPPGVSVLPWPDDRDDELLALRDAAFRDHWGSAPIDPADWHEMVRGHGARADLSAVARDDGSGELVGLCLNHAYPEDDELTGRHEAWIDNLATRAAWRGRGVASALMTWSFRTLRAAGFTHVALGVDADNLTGAARLYRQLGFAPMRRSVTYELIVA